MGEPSEREFLEGLRYEDKFPDDDVAEWGDGWPLAATHCPVCMRPRATDADEDRHAEQECIEPECWCEAICWAETGGECNPTDDVPSWDNLEALCMALRSARSRLSSTTTEVERLRGALRKIERATTNEFSSAERMAATARAALSPSTNDTEQENDGE